MGEACISPKARPDWDEEVRLAAGATVARPQSASTIGYTAPWQMRWDGVSGRHDRFFAGDLLCFVMSAFKVPGAPEVDTEMAVYRVLSIRGPTHAVGGGALLPATAGRPGWKNRNSSALDLLCVGFMRRGQFCTALARNPPASTRSPLATRRCEGVTRAQILASLDVTLAAAPPALPAVPAAAAVPPPAAAPAAPAAPAAVVPARRAAPALVPARRTAPVLLSHGSAAAAPARPSVKRRLPMGATTEAAKIEAPGDDAGDSSNSDDRGDVNYQPPRKKRLRTKMQKAAAMSKKVSSFFEPVKKVPAVRQQNQDATKMSEDKGEQRHEDAPAEVSEDEHESSADEADPARVAEAEEAAVLSGPRAAVAPALDIEEAEAIAKEVSSVKDSLVGDDQDDEAGYGSDYSDDTIGFLDLEEQAISDDESQQPAQAPRQPRAPAVQQSPLPAGGRAGSRAPAVGKAVAVTFDEDGRTVVHRGRVSRNEGSKVFVTYVSKLDDTRERCQVRQGTGRRLVNWPGDGNLQVLDKDKGVANVSATQLRRLARTGGLCGDEVVSALCLGVQAVNVVLPAVPLHWQKYWWDVRVVSGATSSEEDADYSGDEADGGHRNRGIPVDPNDRVLQHMMKLGPHGRSAPQDGPFVIFENSANLGAQDADMLARREIGTKLGVQVAKFDSGKAGVSQALRDRLYWTNIPQPRASDCVEIVHGPDKPCQLLETKPSFDPRPHLNCLTTKEGTDIMNKLNQKLKAQYDINLARGVSEAPKLDRDEWAKIRQNNLLFEGGDSDGRRMIQLRMLTPEERCQIMGFPPEWVTGVSTTVAAKLFGQSFHVPTIELLLSGLEGKLREAIDADENPIGTAKRPLVVVSFFDGIGAAWVALRNCLERWRLANICVHYLAIENDEVCRRVLSKNFKPQVKPENGGYHLHDHASNENWGDIRAAERLIVTKGKRKISNIVGAVANLDDVFLVFNGFPCINVAGLNRAEGANGQQRSMAEDEAGPQTGLYYASERIIGKLMEWKEAGRDDGAPGENGDDDDDGFQVSADPFE